MNRPISCIALVVAALTGAGAADTSFGRTGQTPDSLEWLVADSDVVVRGSVANVSREAPQEQWVWLHVTLKVDETLRGEAAKSLTFAVRTFSFDKRYEQWRDAKQEQLWFLVQNAKYADNPAPAGNPIGTRHRLEPRDSGYSWIRLGPPVDAEKMFKPGPPPIFTMDDVLYEPREILEAARAAVNKSGTQKPVQSHRIDLSLSVAWRLGPSSDYTVLTVPVDRRLEKLARRMIQSPDDFVQKGLALPPRVREERGLDEASLQYAMDSLRHEGVKALRHFKSDENIAILKPLLDDAAWRYPAVHSDEEARREPTERLYYIRKAAYTTLRKWGLKITKPLIRAPLPQKQHESETRSVPVGRPDTWPCPRPFGERLHNETIQRIRAPVFGCSESEEPTGVFWLFEALFPVAARTADRWR